MKKVEFYRVSEPHGYLSNFAPYPIRLEGKVWSTTEHYFQAQKFAGTEHEEAIHLAASPMVAARVGRSRQRPLREDWEAVFAPFTQHPEQQTPFRVWKSNAILVTGRVAGALGSSSRGGATA
jgi:hypothetical protein